MSVPERVGDITVEEYLGDEETSNDRCEYVAGEVFDLDEPSEAHCLLAENVAARLREHLRGNMYWVFVSYMKVQIEAADAFYYPDVMVTRESLSATQDFKRQPCLIIEVLSPNTAMIDRREKLWAYRKLESLREYVMIAQDEARIEVYRRDAPGKWTQEILGPDDELRFESLPTEALRMTMAEVYEDVILPGE